MKLFTNNDTYKIYQGSMLELLEVINPNTIDSVVTDPPYELNFMNKGWDRSGIAFQKETWDKCYQALKPGGYLLAFGGSRTFHRIAVAIEDAGFEIRDVIMWVYGQGFPKSTDIILQLKKLLKIYDDEVKYEKEISREQKTKYNMRPLWETYIQTSKFITKEQWKILQSGLSQQSSYEAMLREKSKESDEDGKESCVEGWSYIQTTEGELQWCKICESTSKIFRYGKERWLYNGAPFSDGNSFEETFKEDGSSSSHRPQSKQQHFREPYVIFLERRAQEIRGKIEEYDGWGTALKPAYEPIIVARKPLKGTVAQNVMKYGVGGINIDECRVGNDEINVSGKGSFKEWQKEVKGFKSNENGVNTTHIGRFPANFIHDGSDEVTSKFPSTEAGGSLTKEYKDNAPLYGDYGMKPTFDSYGDKGNASRFFYTAKASKKDRDEGLKLFEDKQLYKDTREGSSFDVFVKRDENGKPLNKKRKNIHPTVKPCELMQYLVRLVTPKGGTVLDPFMGSGSTGKATMFENRERQANYKFIGIDLDLDNQYCEIANARIDYALNKFQYDEREIREQDKEKGQLSIFDFMD